MFYTAETYFKKVVREELKDAEIYVVRAASTLMGLYIFIL